MQGGLVARKVSAVSLSAICPSVRQTRELWQNGRKYVQSFIPHERPFSLVVKKRMVGGGDPFYLKFWVNRFPLKQKS